MQKTYISIYICTHTHIQIYTYIYIFHIIHIYIYREREQTNKRTKQTKQTNDTNKRNCNCRANNTCPLDSKSLSSNIVYSAEVLSGNNQHGLKYFGICETEFKTRLGNHENSFKNRQKKKTLNFLNIYGT